MPSTVRRILMIAGLLIGLQGCASQAVSPLEGAWELVEAKYTPPDPTFTFADWRQIKILTKTHWSFSPKSERRRS